MDLRRPYRQTQPMEAEVDESAMTPSADQQTQPDLVAIVKWIGDLDDLVRLLTKGLSGAKPWQLRLARHLAEADRLMQVLRLLVAMERAHTEIVVAATKLQLVCRRARHSLDGTRADRTTLAAVQLGADLAASIVHALKQIPSTS